MRRDDGRETKRQRETERESVCVCVCARVCVCSYLGVIRSVMLCSARSGIHRSSSSQPFQKGSYSRNTHSLNYFEYVLDRFLSHFEKTHTNNIFIYIHSYFHVNTL